MGIAVIATTAALGAETAPKQKSAPETGSLYEAGQQLFEQFAPPEVKAQYEFPSKEQWDAFATRFQSALENGSMEDLAEYRAQARAALTAMRGLGIDDELADWLEQRLDEIEGADEARKLPAPKPPAPSPPKPTPAAPALPYYDLWLARVKSRPVPPRAPALMPTLREAFAEEGLPPSLAWLAEAESSFNPNARSPAGARGLFQLMPETAKGLGLSTFLPDERTHAEKSARAAARYLRELHRQFGNWPLALAAYNAGPGRVSRALTSRKAKDFAGVADALPAETRMYVPKVCALVATRTGDVIALR